MLKFISVEEISIHRCARKDEKEVRMRRRFDEMEKNKNK